MAVTLGNAKKGQERTETLEELSDVSVKLAGTNYGLWREAKNYDAHERETTAEAFSQAVNALQAQGLVVKVTAHFRTSLGTWYVDSIRLWNDNDVLSTNLTDKKKSSLLGGSIQSLNPGDKTIEVNGLRFKFIEGSTKATDVDGTPVDWNYIEKLLAANGADMTYVNIVTDANDFLTI